MVVCWCQGVKDWWIDNLPIKTELGHSGGTRGERQTRENEIQRDKEEITRKTIKQLVIKSTLIIRLMDHLAYRTEAKSGTSFGEIFIL